MTSRRMRVVAPVVVLAVFLGLWQLRVFNSIFALPEFAIPLPDQILSAARTKHQELVSSFVGTLTAVGLGWGVGNFAGFVLAVAVLALPSRVARRVSTFFGAFQALPIVALAPLVALWVSSSLPFKVTTISIMVFPQMLVYTYCGLTGVDNTVLELAKSYDTSYWQVFRLFRLPVALAQVFTSLRYSVVLALMGAVVCEILHSADGIGYTIHDALERFDAPLAWSAVVVLALIGVLGYSVLLLVERLTLPWMFRRD